ncbi:MAG: hypothetical protein II862_07415 [Bacteroidales bacterium]|nr:hypothetical protein [Bacteroidales bacterium]
MAKKNNKRLSERLLGALNDIVAKQLMTTDYAHFYIDRNTIKSQGTRDALNRSDSVPTYVKATHWFDIFWYYVNIQVRKNADSSSEIPFVSVSFFQEKGETLNQLFRAEWDNYPEKSHPQPHWHITTIREEGFDNFKESTAVDEDNPFAELEIEERDVNLPKMHFAMAGDWHNDEKEYMVNDYRDEQQLSNWLINLFDHVREELIYAY